MIRIGVIEMNVYIENGYENRQDYLESLSEEYDVDYDTVVDIAMLLGKNEDFDGLVTALEDWLIY